jgi:transcriptional regulator with XRE-family HTH domain
MTAHGLRQARLAKKWRQLEAAARLGVSQSYLAMLERGQRRLTPELARRVARVYAVTPTAVPRSQRALPARLDAQALMRAVAALGYPGFGHLWSRRSPPRNPGEVLRAALAQDNLEPRLVEALPWLVLRYPDLDWSWVVREAKLRDLQNRLGFVVALGRQVARRVGDERTAARLADLEAQLYRSRLAREEPFCQAELRDPERRWLATNRSEDARRWNLLTDWTADAVRYAA